MRSLKYDSSCVEKITSQAGQVHMPRTYSTCAANYVSVRPDSMLPAAPQLQ